MRDYKELYLNLLGKVIDAMDILEDGLLEKEKKETPEKKTKNPSKKFRLIKCKINDNDNK